MININTRRSFTGNWYGRFAVPRTITPPKIKIDTFAYKVYFVQNEKFMIGKTEGIFNGVKLPVYDRERTICDCFKYRTKMDSELFNNAVNAYVIDKKKNLVNLIEILSLTEGSSIYYNRRIEMNSGLHY